MLQNGTPGSALADQEDTERLQLWARFPDLPELRPAPWYQRNVAAAAAGCFGIIGIAVLITAVIMVSSSSKHPAMVHPGVTASASPRPTPTAPPYSDPAPPPATAVATPPTVAATVETESQAAPAPTAPTPVSGPTSPSAPRWWHRLFPHRYPGG
jgi:hypothetical protein